jgi:hypothetical protein
MIPTAPVAVRSEALAAKVVWDPRVRLVPLAGEVKFTEGAGFMGAGVGLGVGVGVGEGFGIVVEEKPFTTIKKHHKTNKKPHGTVEIRL